MQIVNPRRLISILLALIALQWPCDDRVIDKFIFGQHPDDDPSFRSEEYWRLQQQKQLQQQSAPQGEFVAPVAPVAPQGQSAVPQADPPAAAVPGAPVILSTYFPSPIPADGQWHYGWIDFTDAYGDVKSLKIEIMWTTAPVKGPGATRDAEIEGSPTAGKVRMRFT